MDQININTYTELSNQQQMIYKLFLSTHGAWHRIDHMLRDTVKLKSTYRGKQTNNSQDGKQPTE